MSNDPNWPNEQYGETRAPQPGMATGTKILLILLGLFGAFFLLCCAGIIYFVTQMEMDFTQDPQAARTLTQEIADIQIPEEFEPHGTLLFDMVFVRVKGAVYRVTDGQGMLMLAEVRFPQAADFRDQDFRAMMEQQDPEARNLRIKQSEVREFQIRGVRTNFVFSEAEDVETGRDFRQVTGSFPGRDGTGFLMLQIDEDSYDEEAVIRMIESIE